MTLPAPAQDEEVPQLTRALGIPGLADIHVHFLPERMLTKVWDYFDRSEEHYGTAWPVRYRWDQSQRLEHLRSMGLQQIPALTYPHKPGMAGWLNDWNAELAQDQPDVIHCGTFYPEPEAAAYLRRALDSGARLFKAHVQVGGYAPTDSLLDPVWAQLQEAGAPVVIHAGSAPLPGEHTGSRLVREVLDRYPRLVLVIAHMGMPEYHEFADLSETFENVHLDTTMNFTSFTEAIAPVPEDYPERLSGLGEKIILGSDFPNIPYSYAEQLRALVALGLGEEWLRNVLWYNGTQLLGRMGQ